MIPFSEAIFSHDIEFFSADAIPRYSLCYERYFYLGIFLEITENMSVVLSELEKFITQFNTSFVKHEIVILNDQSNDKISLTAQRSLRTQYSSIGWYIISNIRNISCSWYSFRSESLLIGIANKHYNTLEEVLFIAKKCKSSRPRVLVLGVGELSEEKLSHFVTEPQQMTVVKTMNDLASGLDNLHKRSCPGKINIPFIYKLLVHEMNSNAYAHVSAKPFHQNRLHVSFDP